MKRSSGILLSISSLPSPYGIGTLGKAAYDFADFLHDAGQKYWQMLPLGPTSFGDSPYQSFSSFAGNPYFIDLDMLIEDGLITKADLKEADFGDDPRCVDYGKMFLARFDILDKARKNGWERDRRKIAEFVSENSWIHDYALFMACKRHFKMKPWTEWDIDIRMRKPEALEKYRKLLSDDIDLFTYIQYLFCKQWDALREYLKKKGIMTIGDMPIYVSLDSTDVWSEPQFFALDDNYVPKSVAGVPPDYFSEDGQLWGNPVYNWDRMKSDGYGWWIRRIDGATKLYDIIRIDHFRGFSEYWAVPYGDKTARNGKWMNGPGMDLVGVLSGWFRNTSFIAEDLGAPSDNLRNLLRDSGWPGMKVLEFAFDSSESSDFLPHTYNNNCVCYTGTHDNASLLEWLEDSTAQDAAFAFDYLGLAFLLGEKGEKLRKSGIRSGHDVPFSSLEMDEKSKEAFVWGVIRAGASSTADLFVTQIQDYLCLGKGSRMNVPSRSAGNWTWRLLPGEADKALAEKIRHITKLYGRLS